MSKNILNILKKIREELESSKDWGGNDSDAYEFNIGVDCSINVIDKHIQYYSMTPNDLKKKSGLYHN